MKIAIACRWIDGVNGTTTGILETTRRFTTSGWEVHLYGERLDTQRISDAGGISHRIFGWPWGSRFKRKTFAKLFEWRGQKLKPDLIVGHGDTLTQDVLILHNCVHAAHEAIHGAPLPPSSGVGWIHEKMLREQRFRSLVANSELMKRDVAQRFGIPPEKIQVIYPSYDAQRFLAADRAVLGPPVRQKLGLSSEDVLIGLITSGDFKKRGVDIFIAALARLPEDLRRKVHGLVIGKGRRIEDYRRLAAQAGLNNRIHFLTAALENVFEDSRPERRYRGSSPIEHYYHAMDIFAYPARLEEFGQSVQEAMACGLPVLTTRRVGAAELFSSNLPEPLLERPEEEAFAIKLEALIRRPELRQQWSASGMKACQDNTWDQYYKRLRAICESLLQNDEWAK